MLSTAPARRSASVTREQPLLHRTLAAAPAIALAAAVLLMFPTRASAEKWTDLNGTNTIEADMVGLFGDQLVLRMADGRQISVALDKLRAESRIQAKELSRQQADHRQSRITELHGDAAAAAAAAPDPLPTPPTPPAYRPPPRTMTAIETMEYVDRQLVDGGHLLAIFDALPPTTQSQVEQLVGQTSLKIDPEAFQAATGAVYQLANLIVTHQNWIFSHPKFSVVPESDLEQLKAATLGLAGFLRAAFDPELMNLEEIQTVAIRDWLVRFDQATSPYLAKLLSSLKMDAPSYTIEKEGDDEVTVKIIQGPVERDQRLRKVEGVWTLAEIADLDSTWLETMQTKLDDVPDGAWGKEANLTQGVAAMEAQLEPFRSAESAAEFHSAVDEVLAKVQPRFAEIAAAATGSNRRSGSEYGDDYGDDYGEDYGEEYGDDYGN